MMTIIVYGLIIIVCGLWTIIIHCDPTTYGMKLGCLPWLLMTFSSGSSMPIVDERSRFDSLSIFTSCDQIHTLLDPDLYCFKIIFERMIRNQQFALAGSCVAQAIAPAKPSKPGNVIFVLHPADIEEFSNAKLPGQKHVTAWVPHVFLYPGVTSTKFLMTKAQGGIWIFSNLRKNQCIGKIHMA